MNVYVYVCMHVCINFLRNCVLLVLRCLTREMRILSFQRQHLIEQMSLLVKKLLFFFFSQIPELVWSSVNAAELSPLQSNKQ